MPGAFKKSFRAEILYSGPRKGEIPILNLNSDVSSWEVGDKIVVAATSWDPKESEVFTIVECPECSATQVILEFLRQRVASVIFRPISDYFLKSNLFFAWIIEKEFNQK